VGWEVGVGGLHASMVFQFQSIETLHEPVPMSMSIPPMSMPPMSPLMEVLELMAEDAVAVELIVMDMSISILTVGVKGGSGGRVGKRERKKKKKNVVQTSRRVISCIHTFFFKVLNRRPRSEPSPPARSAAGVKEHLSTFSACQIGYFTAHNKRIKKTTGL